MTNRVQRMNEKPRVLVLMGGPDGERAVSLMSGGAVADALEASGRFEVMRGVIERIDVGAARAWMASAGVDVIFPVLHGPWGEGGKLQEVLEEAEANYIGSRTRAAALAMTVRSGNANTSPMTRGMTRTSTGLRPMTRIASTSSRMRMAPISAVKADPERPATMMAEIRTPISRNTRIATRSIAKTSAPNSLNW